MTTETGTAAKMNPAMPEKKKSGRWWKILLGVVGVLVLLVILGPTLMSTGMGKNYIVGKVNAEIPGKVSMEGISLGWFSGAKVQGFKLQDPDGKDVMTAGELTTGLALLDALSSSSLSLGQVKLTGAKAEIVTFEDGTNNVTRSLMKAAAPEAKPEAAKESGGTAISGVIDAVVDELTVRTPTVSVEKTKVTVKLGFDVNTGTGVVRITEDSLVEERDSVTKGGNRISLAKGSVLSWKGKEPINFTGEVDYDLSRLAALVTPLLGEKGVGLKASGLHTMKLRVQSGAREQAESRGSLGTLQLESTTIAWDSISCGGFTLGKAVVPLSMKDGVLEIQTTQIPANNGALTVQGAVDFNQDPPVYVLKKGAAPHNVVSGFAINSEVAGGWLRFLPMTWGASGKDANLLNISGTMRVDVTEAYIPLKYAEIQKKGAAVAAINIEQLKTDAPIFRQLSLMLTKIPGFDQLEKATSAGGDIRDIRIVLANGKVSYENFRLGSSWGNLTFAGRVGLDQTLAMTVTVGTKGINLPIPIGLGGTTSSPKPEMSQDFLKDLGGNLGGTVKDLGKGVEDIGKGLGDLFKKDKDKK